MKITFNLTFLLAFCLLMKSCYSQCPANYMCLPNATPNLPCPDGSYSKSGELTCTICPAGKRCSEYGEFDCTGGTYSLEGENTCTNCPLDHKCPAPCSAPIRCEPGEYAPAGRSVCTVCPEGKACALGVETACPTGEYSVKGVCMPCPAGHKCINGKATKCNPGYYSTTGDCKPCPAGQACPELCITPYICPAGTFSLAEATECTLCPVGKKCPTTTADAIPCPIGTYQNLKGQTDCITCVAAKDCTTAGKEDLPIVCGTGFYFDGFRCYVSVLYKCSLVLPVMLVQILRNQK